MTAPTSQARAPPFVLETTTRRPATDTPHLHEEITIMQDRQTPEARVVAYHPPTRHRPAATVEVACPFGCLELTPTGRAKKNAGPRRHVHGIGAAGQRPDLGNSRVAHCAGNPGRSYVLVDPDSLVPARLAVEPALSLAGLDEARRRRARVQPARDLPWGRATEVTK